MAKTEKKLHFPVGVCLICLFAAVISVKGIGYGDGATPPPNGNCSIWTLIVNENQTSMLQIPAKRMNEKYDLALFKEGNKILTLLKNNSLVYVNTESIEEKQKNEDHFQMLLLNASYFEITIKGGSSYMYIQGNYKVRYYMDGKIPPEDPEPLCFSIEIINTTEANSTQGTNEEHSSPLRMGVPSPSIPATTKTEENVTSIKPTENGLQPTMASVNYSSTGTGYRPITDPPDQNITSENLKTTGLVHMSRSPAESSSQLKKLILGVAISGSILVVIILCICLGSWHHKNKKRSRIGADVSGTEGGGSVELQGYLVADPSRP